VSSFGFFLSLAFLYSIFLIWRQARAADIDEERVLDLSLLTFLGGFIGGRLYFILENLQYFGFDVLKMLYFFRYPGFSFWGGFLGGWISLYYLSRRFKLDFWQMADLASVAFLGGLIMADIGCLLGGCGVGVRSNFLGIEMVGVVDKRFPVSLLEAIFFVIVLLQIWPKAIHFHLRGRIVSTVLIFIGVIKFLTEFLRENQGTGYLLSLILIALGITIHYQVVNTNLKSGKKEFIKDVKYILSFPVKFITDKKMRDEIMVNLGKNWYNHKVNLAWKLQNLSKSFSINKFLRRIRVKSTIKNS